MALREDARDDDTSSGVRQFTYWLRRYCKRKLWRPTWEAAKVAGLAASVEDDDGKDVRMRCGETALLFDGGVMGEVLLCEGCDGEVYLKCSGLDDMPEDEVPYSCGCDDVDGDDEDVEDGDDEDVEDGDDVDDDDDVDDGDDGGDGGVLEWCPMAYCLALRIRKKKPRSGVLLPRPRRFHVYTRRRYKTACQRSWAAAWLMIAVNTRRWVTVVSGRFW